MQEKVEVITDLVQAFNVYVWPRPCSRSAPDPRFLCQTSSIDFLINQNFDFNKLFKDGVSYLQVAASPLPPTPAFPLFRLLLFLHLSPQPVEMEKMRASLRERQENRRLSQVKKEGERGMRGKDQ